MLNFGDNQLDKMWEIIRVDKKGNPKAMKSTINFCEIYSNNCNLNFTIFTWEAEGVFNTHLELVIIKI